MQNKTSFLGTIIVVRFFTSLGYITTVKQIRPEKSDIVELLYSKLFAFKGDLRYINCAYHFKRAT